MKSCTPQLKPPVRRVVEGDIGDRPGWAQSNRVARGLGPGSVRTASESSLAGEVKKSNAAPRSVRALVANDCLVERAWRRSINLQEDRNCLPFPITCFRGERTIYPLSASRDHPRMRTGTSPGVRAGPVPAPGDSVLRPLVVERADAVSVVPLTVPQPSSSASASNATPAPIRASAAAARRTSRQGNDGGRPRPSRGPAPVGRAPAPACRRGSPAEPLMRSLTEYQARRPYRAPATPASALQAEPGRPGVRSQPELSRPGIGMAARHLVSWYVGMAVERRGVPLPAPPLQPAFLDSPAAPGDGNGHRGQS